MKKLIFYLMALLLPLSAFEMSADDESAVIKVPLIVELCCHKLGLGWLRNVFWHRTDLV